MLKHARLASYNPDVPTVEERQRLHEQDIRRDERRTVIRKRYRTSLENRNDHALLCAIGILLVALPLLVFSMEGLLPSPPEPWTFHSLKRWTMTPEYRIPAGFFIAGVGTAWACMHAWKVRFHMRRARSAQDELQKLNA